MRKGAVGAWMLLALLAAARPGAAQSATHQGATRADGMRADGMKADGMKADGMKADGGDADASLKHDLVLHFDECKVLEGKTFTAEVTLQVTPAGQPTAVALSRSSGSPCLDSVAVAAVQAAQFSPAREHGKAVVRDVVMPVDFMRMNMAQNDGLKKIAGMKAAEVLSKPQLQVGNCKVKSGTHPKAVAALTVDPDGKPTNVHLVEATGDSCLDEVALKDAAGYLFAPARRDGRAISFEMQIEMVFEP